MATVWLFDFGYMYRFDPLRQFNSAGDGSAAPQCHLAERIESRHAFGAWLDLTEAEALEALPPGKDRRPRRVPPPARGTGGRRSPPPPCSAWLDGITATWQAGLGGDLRALWLCEGWRSHVLDLEDDLHGRPARRTRCGGPDWLLATLRDHHGLLVRPRRPDGRRRRPAGRRAAGALRGQAPRGGGVPGVRRAA